VAAEAADIAVLGAGPAGAAAALGLAALGYDVAVVTSPSARARARRESFSARVVAALRELGVDAALAAIEAPGARIVHWAGAERELPGEAQVERARFDEGLAQDLAGRGVRVLNEDAAAVRASEGGVRVALAPGRTLAARFAVEARGRAAPGGGERERGPETVCLVQRWKRTGRAGDAGGAPGRIAIASLEDGWIWLANDGRGGLTAQLALDASQAPPREELATRVAQALRADDACAAWLGDATPDGEPFARAATPVLSAGLVSAETLRVGDAALAVDPLSGNGVFQALSTALVAPAVIHTLLRKPERAALARAFYTERARDLFLRFGRVSRDFYALGAAHHGGAFWGARAAWPDAQPVHTPAGSARAAIARRPVVCDGWIEEREVILTAERPLGIWQVAGIELAPLVRALAAGARAESADGDQAGAREARMLAALPYAAREPVAAWLRAHRVALQGIAEAEGQAAGRRSE
jgi:flavin-dependent dehydrogenase